MIKRREITWVVFTVLFLGSVACSGYGLLVYHHTPMLVHDTLHNVQQLTDEQGESLYPALLKAYKPVVFGFLGASIGWAVFTALVISSLVREQASVTGQTAGVAQARQ
jgi:hypothetical protein